MVFSSVLFLCLFLPLVLVLYYNPFMPKNRMLRNTILLLMSLVFYGWGEPRFIVIMVTVTVVTWCIGLLMEYFSTYKKFILWTGIALHVTCLFIFKYLTFTMNIWNSIWGINTEILNIALPIGISFFSFQLMSYLFDIYYGNAKAQKNVLNVLLYISLFPQLIAGPIVRYQQIASELEHRSDNYENVCKGLYRFIIGLSKKVLLANYMAIIADNMFQQNMQLSVASAWLGAIAYTLQIYFDFSGYSDMAIGLGKMFGFNFPENFNFPYVAKSVTDFWRRWHMSLTHWFRDYVYIPLGGNRVSKARWIRNLLFVWLLTGIWHGANWTFIVWGLLYFCVLLMEKLTDFTKYLGCIGAHIYTMLIVICAWVIFRSPDLSFAVQYLSIMFGYSSIGVIDGVFLYYIQSSVYMLVLGIICVTPIANYSCNKVGLVKSVLVVILFGLSLVQVVSSTYNPFIYFNF